MTTTERYAADWHGCYNESWKDVIADEAFVHPAKFAFGRTTLAAVG